MKLLRRKAQTFEVQVQDLTLQVTAPPDLIEEARAAALTFREQIQSFSLQHPEFRSSKRPLKAPAQAPGSVQEMTAAAADAGVGPIFALRGAVADEVGRILARSASEITVACEGDMFLLRRKRSKMAVRPREGRRPIAVVLEPRPEGVGVATSTPRGEGPDGLAVIACTSMLAASATAGVQALLGKPNGLRSALRYLERVPGVIGGVVIEGERIGVAGTVELAS